MAMSPKKIRKLKELCRGDEYEPPLKKLPKESILEFQKICKKETGKNITFKEAEEMSMELLDFGKFVIETSQRIREREAKNEEKKFDEKSSSPQVGW